MSHPPEPIPRTAHLPLLSAVMSGPPFEPFWLRKLSFAPLTGAPVFLSTTDPDRRLLPRQSSAANAAAAMKIAAMIVSVFFKLGLPLGDASQKKNCPLEIFPSGQWNQQMC